MKVLIVDNYDSFTYNLLQLVEQIFGKQHVFVAKNDEISLDEIQQYDKIILSPGPGIPSEAGLLLEVIKNYWTQKPILGVCLGLQAIVEAFGGELQNLSEIHHGVASNLHIKNKNTVLFQNIPNHCSVGRYHSWAAKTENFPKDLEITATDEKGIVMALAHQKYPIHAVQFHPESILTPLGKKMMENFLLLN
ncbi:anthranilate synthase component II [Amniculibacterium sp. G2-70]|uniref:anthranilate synthase component II n=1 Tax=Amniculibacterium sp. G2-70 TaxID=2767188 RepID=UPI0016546397|nr:aminodeoxychorismate/anthranilate synthase component II [Amniculibacterium sp. G2-70]